MYSCHLFLISFASVRSLLCLSFIMPTLARNIPLMSPVFLKRSLAFPVLLYPSTSWHYSFKKAFFSLPAILWNSAFSWAYLSLSLLLFAMCKAFLDNLFAFLHFFCFGMVVVTASYIMLQTSVHSSPGSLSTRSNPLNLFVTSIV